MTMFLVHVLSDAIRCSFRLLAMNQFLQFAQENKVRIFTFITAAWTSNGPPCFCIVWLWREKRYLGRHVKPSDAQKSEMTKPGLLCSFQGESDKMANP